MMKIPKYDIIELEWAERNGTYYLVDFANFINDIVNREIPVYNAEYIVATSVNTKGTKYLSNMHLKLLERIFEKYSTCECNRCNAHINLSEIAEFLKNGNFCDYCYHQSLYDYNQ